MSSIEYKSPIVESIVKNVLEVFSSEINVKERFVLNADLVPRVRQPNLLKRENFQQSIIHTQPIVVKRELSPKINPSNIKPIVTQQKIIQRKVITPQSPQDPDPRMVYRKILQVLRDPLVTHIECLGPNFPLTVKKGNFSQKTNIILKKDEIDEFLEYVSEQARIPIVPGVFRAVVDDFYINAVISDILEPKFMITKQFPSYDII